MSGYIEGVWLVAVDCTAFEEKKEVAFLHVFMPMFSHILQFLLNNISVCRICQSSKLHQPPDISNA